MPSAVTTPQAFRRLQIAWAASTLMLLVGILSVSLSGDLRAVQPGQGSAVEVAGPSDLDLEDESTSDAHYGGADLTVVGARPVPVNNSGRPIIVVDFEARNTTDFQLRFPARHFTLVETAEQAQARPVGDSSEEPATIAVDRFEYSDNSDRIVLDPGQLVEATAVFKLLPGASTDLEDYNLQISESGRWPATVPLTGSAEPNPALQPLTFADRDDADVITDVGTSRISIIDTESSLDFGSYRAFTGEHLALFVLEIAGDDQTLVEAAKQTAFWQLSVGDETHQAMRVEVGGQTVEATTFVVVFAYPSDSTDLVLHGDGGNVELGEFVIETL